MASLAAGAIAVAAGDLALGVACYRTRTALGGIVSIGSAVLVGLSAGRVWKGSVARDEVIGALAFLAVGAVLLGLGQAVDRLLTGPSEGGSSDAPPEP
jgi:membrane protein DedA with SNARE-associated domain